MSFASAQQHAPCPHPAAAAHADEIGRALIDLQEVLDGEVDDVRAERVRKLLADALQADDERRAEVDHHEPEELDPCPGRRPSKGAVRRPARPYVAATQNRFAMENAKET